MNIFTFFVDISTISLDLLLFLVTKNQFYPWNGLLSVKNIFLLFGTFGLENYVQYKKFPKSNSKLFLCMGRPNASHITFKRGDIFRVFFFNNKNILLWPEDLNQFQKVLLIRNE